MARWGTLNTSALKEEIRLLLTVLRTLDSQGCVQNAKRGTTGLTNVAQFKNAQGQPLNLGHGGTWPKNGQRGPPPTGAANKWGSGGAECEPDSRTMSFPHSSERPWRATKGSAKWDLSSTSRLVLTPQMGVQLIDTDFKGPLASDTVGLLIGRSSTTLKEIRIHPEIIDPEYTGVVKVMAESPKGITVISPGDRIAQLIVLPSLHRASSAHPIQWGNPRIWILRQFPGILSIGS